MDPWLVRTAQNQIAGPYSKEQIIDMIQRGQIGLQDEVCQANHYWIYLHEREEVSAQLGIEVLRSKKERGDEEITETQTESLRDEETDPGINASGYRGDANSDDDCPELDEAVLGEHEKSTSRMKRRKGPGEIRKSSSASKVRPGYSDRFAALATRGAEALPSMESPSIWRGFAWALIAGVALVLVLVLRLTRG